MRDQAHDSLFYLVHLGTRKPMQQNNVPALHVTEISQAPFQRLRQEFAPLGWNSRHITYSPDLAGLLSSGTARQRQSNTAYCANNIAPPHSITSSASARSVGGMVRFNKRAVFRLM